MTKKINGLPWMQKIKDNSAFVDSVFKGYHRGNRMLYGTVSKNEFDGNNVNLEGITWYGSWTSTAEDWTVDNLFTSGVKTQINNKKDYNTCFFAGSSHVNTGFLNQTFNYPSTSISGMVRDAIGFAVRNSCIGSHSDKGGDSQAYLQKVGLFYADPSANNKRYIFLADQYMSGNFNINQPYPNNSQTYYYNYRLSEENIKKVNDKKLLLMGLGFQFFHGGKSASHTSVCNLSEFRILVGDGPNMIDENPNRILIYNYDQNLGNYKAGEVGPIHP